MNTQKVNISKIAPVLMAFFVMSFVDLVGIGVDRVSKDMSLSATLSQLIPSAAFLHRRHKGDLHAQSPAAEYGQSAFESNT